MPNTLHISNISLTWVSLCCQTESMESSVYDCQRKVCSTVHRRSEPIHQAEASRPANEQPWTCSTGQSWPVSTTPAAIYLQQQNSFYKKFTRHTRLFGQWKKFRTSIVCSVAFIYKTRDELSRHLCRALCMSSHLCWGTWLFPWHPPTGSWSPLCYPVKKKILESPLISLSSHLKCVR